MPRTRYRVIERGRRLVVVDNWHGGRPVAEQPAERRAPTRARIEAPRASVPSVAMRPRAPAAATGDAQVLTTQRWFDDKAPRRVRIGGGAQGGLGLAIGGTIVAIVLALSVLGWPAVPVLVFLLLQPRVRKGFRRAATRWLDGLDTA